MGSRVYAGRTTSTRKERVVYSCPCGERFAAEVWRGVDARDAAEAKQLQDGTLNRVRCPSCAAQADVQVPVVFHDGAAERLVLGAARRAAPSRAAGAGGAVRRARRRRRGAARPTCSSREVVFGAAGLRALLAPPPTEAAFDATSEPTPVVPAARLSVEPPAAARPVEKSADRSAAKSAELRPDKREEKRDDKREEKPQLALLPSLQDEETPLPQPSWAPTRVDQRVPEPLAAGERRART